jgi:hypothetical protein
MSEKFFKIIISEEAEINVFIMIISGLVVNFVVKLILKMDGEAFEVIRFDSGHECPHKDILKPDGDLSRKIWYESLDNDQALDIAVKDLKENYDFYIERFKKWLKYGEEPKPKK